MTRVDFLMKGEDFFAAPSFPIPISWPFNFDVDNRVDLIIANLILEKGLVTEGMLN